MAKLSLNDNILTLSVLLRTLQGLVPYRRLNQSQLFRALFRSYCQAIGGDADPDWIPSQGCISKLFGGNPSMLRNLNIHYIAGDCMYLRNDVVHYVTTIATTAKLRRMHQSALVDLVDRCVNIDPVDKAYILKYTDAAEDDMLSELLYRMLYILLNEP